MTKPEIGEYAICPHCDRILAIALVDTMIREAVDGFGNMRPFVVIVLEDGTSTRAWLRYDDEKSQADGAGATDSVS